MEINRKIAIQGIEKIMFVRISKDLSVNELLSRT